MAPDTNSADIRENPENEGRRVERVPGGWRLVNYAKYREMQRAEERRDKWAGIKREQRKRTKEDRLDFPPSESESESESEGNTYVEFVEVWNANRGELPRAYATRAGPREKRARARLRDVPDLVRWGAAVRRLAASDFALGRSKGSNGWIADFEFLIKPESLTKIEEGKYDNHASASRPTTPGRYADVVSEEILDDPKRKGDLG